MQPDDQVVLRFVGKSDPFSLAGRCYPGYNANERAGFEPTIAALLVRRGVAVPVEAGDEPRGCVGESVRYNDQVLSHARAFEYAAANSRYRRTIE
jgi:hypothetical protein